MLMMQTTVQIGQLLTYTRLHGATTQKTANFKRSLVLFQQYIFKYRKTTFTLRPAKFPVRDEAPN
jgi:hypothetical protein